MKKTEMIGPGIVLLFLTVAVVATITLGEALFWGAVIAVCLICARDKSRQHERDIANAADDPSLSYEDRAFYARYLESLRG
jgi:hypothetical protein